MRRMTRYVVAEFFKIFCVTLALITAVMVLGVAVNEAIREGISPGSVVRLLPFVLPIALLYAIPCTTLFAVCSVYGRMSAANEIVAIKSAGLSPMCILSPILIVTFVMSVMVVWLNDVAVSWGRTGAKRVVLESVEQIVYGMLRTHKTYTTKKFSISVRAVDGKRLINPSVTLRVNDVGPPWLIIAEEAELHCDVERERLTIVLRDCEIDYGDFHIENPDEYVHSIPLSLATRRGYDSNRPSDIALERIPDEIEAERRRIEEMKRSFAAEAAVQMLAGELDALTSPEWSERHTLILDAQSRLHRLHTETPRRFANGFSCFCFALVGAPLAIRLRNADGWSSFGLCFLPILVAYYPLMIYGVDLAKSGEMPPLCVWLGNLVLGLVGYWLSRKVFRY